MHGMTQNEIAEFKRIKAASRAVHNRADIEEMKRMAAEWVRAAPSAAAKARRYAASHAFKFAFSHFE